MRQNPEGLGGESPNREFDRLPPHSIESEMCLIASMMLDKDMVGQIVQIIDREAFFQADHQIIYDIIVKLYEQNRPIDPLDRPRGTFQAPIARRNRAA